MKLNWYCRWSAMLCRGWFQASNWQKLWCTWCLIPHHWTLYKKTEQPWLSENRADMWKDCVYWNVRSGMLNLLFSDLKLLLVHPFNGLFSRTTWVSLFQKGKTSLDFKMMQEMTGFGDGSGISRTICKQSAARQITTPTPHHSICVGRMLFLTPNRQC